MVDQAVERHAILVVLAVPVELADKLKEQGMEEIEASVANKISRGAFTAAFLMASLTAIGAETVHVKHV